MATSQSFDNIGLSAAQVASTADLERNLRSSFYITDKQPSRVDSAKAKIKNVCHSTSKPVKKLFRGKKHGMLEMQPLPPPVQNAEALAALEGERTVAMSPYYPPSTIRGWGVHEGPSRGATAENGKTKSALFTHPAVKDMAEPPTPATTASAPVSTSEPSLKGTSLDDSSSMYSIGPLADGQKPLRPKTIYDAIRKSRSEGESSSVFDEKKFKGNLDDFHPDKDTKTTSFPTSKPFQFRPRKAPTVPTQPPALGPVKPIDPHISGFDCYTSDYVEGMYYKTCPNMFSIPEANESSPVENTQTTVDPQVLRPKNKLESKAVSRSESDSATGEKRPEYTSKYCPRGDDGRIYSTAGKGFDKSFDPYGASTRASSQVLPIDGSCSSTRPSTPATTSTSVIPFTPASKNTDRRETRHSKFYVWVEEHGGLTPGVTPSYPVDSPRPGARDSAVDFETVYTNVSTPPTPELPPKIPVPRRKPVPKSSSAATAGASKSKANVNKPLPDSPGLDSPRCFTPTPAGKSSFPPRADSLNNPVFASNSRPARPQTVLLRPNDYPAAATPPPKGAYAMNPNGYPMYDTEAGRRYSAEPTYRVRGPMNEMEKKTRESMAKRAESVKRAVAEVEAKRERKAKKAAEKE